MFHCKVECRCAQVCVTLLNLPVTSRCLWWTFLCCQWYGHTNIWDQNSLFRSLAPSLESPQTYSLLSLKNVLNPSQTFFQFLTWIESLLGERMSTFYGCEIYKICSRTLTVVFLSPRWENVNTRVFHLTEVTYFRKRPYPPNKVWLDEAVLLRHGKRSYTMFNAKIKYMKLWPPWTHFIIF